MKTKHNVFVPVGSQQEAEMQRSILHLMRYTVQYDFGGHKNTYLRFNLANQFIFASTNVGLTQVTFGELIDILSKPEKIAVKVENELQVRAICNFKCWEYKKTAFIGKEDCVIYVEDDSFGYNRLTDHNQQELDRFTIIPFQDFAKEHNINVPLLISEDNVELFEGDAFFFARYCCNRKIWYLDYHDDKISEEEDEHEYVLAKETPQQTEYDKYFSTKESALKWIEEQKPTSIGLTLDNGAEATVFDIGQVNFDKPRSFLLKSDIQAIAKAMEELK